MQGSTHAKGSSLSGEAWGTKEEEARSVKEVAVLPASPALQLTAAQQYVLLVLEKNAPLAWHLPAVGWN